MEGPVAVEVVEHHVAAGLRQHVDEVDLVLRTLLRIDRQVRLLDQVLDVRPCTDRVLAVCLDAALGRRARVDEQVSGVAVRPIHAVAGSLPVDAVAGVVRDVAHPPGHALEHVSRRLAAAVRHRHPGQRLVAAVVGSLRVDQHAEVAGVGPVRPEADVVVLRSPVVVQAEPRLLPDHPVVADRVADRGVALRLERYGRATVGPVVPGGELALDRIPGDARRPVGCAVGVPRFGVAGYQDRIRRVFLRPADYLLREQAAVHDAQVDEGDVRVWMSPQADHQRVAIAKHHPTRHHRSLQALPVTPCISWDGPATLSAATPDRRWDETIE